MADTKIEDLTSDASPTSDDLIVTVTDPAGTPANRKVTLTNAITKAHGLSDGIVKVDASVMTNAVAGTDYVAGAASSVDNSIVRFDGTGGKTIQAYTSNPPTVDDTGIVAINNKAVITSLAGPIVTIGDNATDLPNTIVSNVSQAFDAYGLYVSCKNTNASASSGSAALTLVGESTSTLNDIRSVRGVDGQTTLTTSGITQASHYGVRGYGTGFLSSGSSTISNFYGLFGSPFVVTGGSIAITRNYAAGFDGDIAMIANKLQWTSAHDTNPDTNLYRSAADTLKTDDSLIVNSELTISTITAGSILFAGTSGLISQDNTNLFFDNTNNRLGVARNPTAYPLEVTGAVASYVTNANARFTAYSPGANFPRAQFTISNTASDVNVGFIISPQVDNKPSFIEVATYSAVTNASAKNTLIYQAATYAVIATLTSENNNGTSLQLSTRSFDGTKSALYIEAATAQRIGIGVNHTSPSAQLHILATTEQLRVGYDASNYYSTTISSAGAVTFNAVGASSAFTFSDAVTVTSLTNSSLTSGRVTFAGASGVLQDDADFTFSVDTLTVTKIAATTFTGKVTLSNPINLMGYTVAGLPAGVIGEVAYVTDALAPAFLTAVVGGGAIVAPVFYNGTNWVAY